MSSPSLDFSSVETKPISDELIAAPSWLVIFPTKLNSEAPFPSLPSVVIYETVITLLFDSFLANENDYKEIPFEGPNSGLSVSVPGAVDAWEELSKKYGNFSLDTLLVPAIDLANNGFPVSEVIADYWSKSEKKLLINAKNVPAGLGEPVYGKLDADLAGAMMSINAVKGVEIGAGNEAVELSGDENSDEIRANKNKKIIFSSNNSGGILGGISSGQDLNLSITIKPTSSILKAKKTINNKFQNTSISTKGRHDPCVGLRAVPIAEAMMACVLVDHVLRNRAQCG